MFLVCGPALCIVGCWAAPAGLTQRCQNESHPILQLWQLKSSRRGRMWSSDGDETSRAEKPPLECGELRHPCIRGRHLPSLCSAIAHTPGKSFSMKLLCCVWFIVLCILKSGFLRPVHCDVSNLLLGTKQRVPGFSSGLPSLPLPELEVCGMDALSISFNLHKIPLK